ncbi:alpha/beta fold hydrolase [Methanoregula sp.]|uniref:alpha/beta fold hydrolase n=1 Tax=Methanoregula sp. TaxID=2052170 RepID=UPI000CB5EDEE|nr:alpha/beta fold hydrolase [Methanoregula sp.]PKG32317.1 MAG: alpha/beta hydrolase [Methanoregula sp.]
MLRLPEPDVKTAEVNGITLAYREIGSGYPLILINGFASTMDTWNPPFLSALSHQFRTTIFDNRGTGYTSDTDAPYSISLFAEDTVALMDTLGIARAHILGLSMGASIAQELVLAHPDRVERLVLAAGTCGGPEMVPMRKETWDRLADKRGSPAELADRMFSVLFPKDWLATHDPWQYCPEVHETTSEENAGRQAAAFFGWTGAWERLPEIRCPALVITGTADVVIPPENSRNLASRIPGARLAEIPGAGHGMQYQSQREFSGTVLEFLRD